MKTIKMNDGAIVRVNDDYAQKIVNAGKGKFVPKKEYKKIRDAK